MSKKLLALLLALVMIVGSFTSVLAADPATETKKETVEEKKEEPAKTEEKKDEKSEEKKDEKSEEKKDEKSEEKKEEKKEEVDEALVRAQEVLKKAGIISGYSKDSEDFKAEKNVTRAEFASMIVRALNLEASAKSLATVPTGFKDVPTNLWANGYIAVAKQQGIINGYPNGTFQPNRQISYQDMATMLTIALGKAEVGTVYPAGYIVKAQQLGLFNKVDVPAYTDMATRGNVFKMVYNMITSKDFGQRKVLKAIVLENSRVENLADDEITVEVIDVVQKADWVAESRDKKGDQHTYKLDKELMLDPEQLLGKVVDISVDKNDKIVEVKEDKTYDYLEGAIDSVGPRKFELNDKLYSAAFDERYDSTDERIFRTYLNNKDYTYAEFAKAYKTKAFDFARITVKNGKVIFIDAYQFNDIAPVAEVKDGNVYYLDDSWNANVVKASKLADRVVFKDSKGYSVAERKAVAKDDVIHFYNNYEDAIVRKDAKIEAKLDKTILKRNGQFAVFGKDEYVLNEVAPFQAIYSFEGKKYFVVVGGDRLYLDGIVGDKVKALVALDDSVQLIEGAKAWNDGIQAIKQITGKAEVKFLPSKGEEFWAEETRDTYYFDRSQSLNNRLYDFKLEDIVYLAKGEKDTIKAMGNVLPYETYKNTHPYAKINSRFISLDTNKRDGVSYRYFDNLHAYALDKNGRLHQVGELNKFIADNADNKDLEAFVMSERELKDQLSNEKKLNLNTYSFLSDDPFLASIVVFKNAVMTYNADEVYAEVLRVWNDKTAIDVVDANSNVFTVELVRDVDAITSYKIGDVVVLKLMKDTKDKDVKKGCVTKVEIDKYAPSYLIENGDYPQTYKINGTNYRWDAKQTVFYPNSSRTVQYTLDKAGFIKVMRYVKAGASDVLTNILDKKAVESSNNRVVVLRDSEGKFVTNFYIDRNTEFIDETGRSMGFDHWGLEKFNAIYGDGQVEVVANGRFASIVRGLRTEKAMNQASAMNLVKKAVDAIEGLGKQKYASNVTTTAAIQTAFEAEVKKALDKAGLALPDGSYLVNYTVTVANIPAADPKDAKISTKVEATVAGETATLTAKNDYHVNKGSEDTDDVNDQVKVAKKAITDMEASLNKAKDPIKVGKKGTGANDVYQDADVKEAVMIAMSKAKVENFDLTKVSDIKVVHVKDNEYTLTFKYTLPNATQVTSNTVSVMFEI